MDENKQPEPPRKEQSNISGVFSSIPAVESLFNSRNAGWIAALLIAAGTLFAAYHILDETMKNMTHALEEQNKLLHELTIEQKGATRESRQSSIEARQYYEHMLRTQREPYPEYKRSR